jgi:hypothetical protein
MHNDCRRVKLLKYIVGADRLRDRVCIEATIRGCDPLLQYLF